MFRVNGGANLQSVPSIFPQWAQDLNTGLSFFGFVFTTIGLILTIWVAWQVNKIRQHYLAKGRLPDVVKQLENSGSRLNAHLEGWPAMEREFRGEIKVAATLMKSASRMLGRQDGERARSIERKFTKELPSDRMPADDAWDAYSDVQTVIVSLSEVKKNMDWN
jgi:hypothetical protein